jgi:hypothetical protein
MTEQMTEQEGCSTQVCTLALVDRGEPGHYLIAFCRSKGKKKFMELEDVA